MPRRFATSRSGERKASGGVFLRLARCAMDVATPTLPYSPAINPI